MAAPTSGLLARVGWYVREVMGENAYDHYVEHARREHPDAPVLSRREFERRRMDEQDRNPGIRRCC
jgi:uncharacterized short protein YbdD (DUF466 family)